MAQMTKKALATSLKKLLQTKPLTRITINDITEDCGVNRMTFYYHFSDIYALVEWILQEDTTKALKTIKTYSTWQQGFVNVFRSYQEDSAFILNVYHYVGTEKVEAYLYRILFDMMKEIVDDMAEGMLVEEKDKIFIVDFYKYALVGIVMNWIKNDMKDDPDEIIRSLDEMFSGNIARALENCRQDKVQPQMAAAGS
jgi:probable dihydroxyacetone kinase regulator